MTELSKLPPAIRAERYLALAGDALRHAAMSKGPLRDSYLLMAEQWRKMAAEAAAEINSDGGSN